MIPKVPHQLGEFLDHTHFSSTVYLFQMECSGLAGFVRAVHASFQLGSFALSLSLSLPVAVCQNGLGYVCPNSSGSLRFTTFSCFFRADTGFGYFDCYTL